MNMHGLLAALSGVIWLGLVSGIVASLHAHGAMPCANLLVSAILLNSGSGREHAHAVNPIDLST
jgi:hypothetical protein